MTWIGQKRDPQPTRTIPTANDVSLPIPSRPNIAAPAARMEMPQVASIGKSLYIKGELSGNEDLAIDGKVDGTIALNGYQVTIGETGRVAAEIRAKSVVVGGSVTGHITSDERVEVAATGTLVGDIRAPRVVLVDGSRFKGSINMDSGPAASKATGNSSAAHDHASTYAGSTKS